MPALLLRYAALAAAAGGGRALCYLRHTTVLRWVGWRLVQRPVLLTEKLVYAVSNGALNIVLFPVTLVQDLRVIESKLRRVTVTDAPFLLKPRALQYEWKWPQNDRPPAAKATKA